MMTKEEIDALGHGLAYSAACTAIESECVRCDEGWFDVSIENFGDDDVLDSVKYLDARGLIDRNPDNPDWIQLRDESEAVETACHPTPDTLQGLFRDRPTITFREFQITNALRCSEAFNHTLEDWLPAGWPLAICGEVGELANLMKKVLRGDFTIEDKRKEIEGEIADVICYCDLFASAIGADTGEIVRRKFNEVTKRVNWRGMDGDL
jgi:NTP pyrophosphatase (non-canonical NTP hydrolase)